MPSHVIEKKTWMTGSDVVIYTVSLQSSITPTSSTPGWHILLLENWFICRSWPEELESLFPPFGEFTLAEVPGQNLQYQALFSTECKENELNLNWMTIFPVLYSIYNTAVSPSNDLITQTGRFFFFYVRLLCEEPLKPPLSFLFFCSINFQGIASLILEVFPRKTM